MMHRRYSEMINFFYQSKFGLGANFVSRLAKDSD